MYFVHRKDPEYHDILVHISWFCVMHELPSVRVAASQLLATMACEDNVGQKVVSTKVLPALITLSTDQDK